MNTAPEAAVLSSFMWGCAFQLASPPNSLSHYHLAHIGVSIPESFIKPGDWLLVEFHISQQVIERRDGLGGGSEAYSPLKSYSGRSHLLHGSTPLPFLQDWWLTVGKTHRVKA